MAVLRETKRVAWLGRAPGETCVSGHAGGSDRGGAMTAPGTVRIAPHGFATAPGPWCPDGGPAPLASLRPIGAAVPAGGLSAPRGKSRRGHAGVWGALSLLVHAAAVVMLLAVVQPQAVEMPAPEAGVSMVFADVAPVAPALPAAPEDPPVTAEKLPEPSQSLPDPPAQAASVQPEPAPAAAAAVEPEAAASLPTPPVPPVPPAPAGPARSTHVAPARVARSEDVSRRTAAPAAPAAAPVAASAPPAVAPIIAPHPVAGMADNRPPRYPESARRRQEQGRVMVGVSVAADGTPIDTRIDLSSGHPALDEAAMEAVRQWRFVPGSQDNRPVVASAEVPIVFRLQD
jgi:periplasmic protein TonB